MNTFKLIAGDVFHNEWEASKARKFQYSSEERRLIEIMADQVKHYYFIQCMGDWDKLGEVKDVDGGDEKYYLQLHKGFENNKNVYPYFFTTRNKVIHYANCKEEVPFEEREDYSLFLLFKLRNLSLHELMKWLLGLHQLQGNEFLEFLPLHLDEYGDFYNDKHVRNIRKWLAGNDTPLVTHTLSVENVTEQKSEDDNLSSNDSIRQKVEQRLKINQEVIAPLAELLKPYFSENVTTDDLKDVLKGNVPKEKLYFESNGNQLSTLFSELHEKKMIIGSYSTTITWICNSFLCANSKTKRISTFKVESVKDVFFRPEKKASESKRIDLTSIMPNIYQKK